MISMTLLITSCTEGFEQINSNPNSPESIGPQFLLSNVISVAADQNTYSQGMQLSSYLCQFTASVEFERIDRYELGSNGQYWNRIYGLLNDIESIQTLPNTNEAYIAVSDIMKSYLFSQLTDMWGDVPYTEALGAKAGVYNPTYDIQESIYTDPETGILAVLARSAVVLKNTSSSIQGDMMYTNDLSKWVKFANSLRVRYLLRISKRLTDFTELQELVDQNELMTGNADNAVVPYLSSAPNQWPLSQAALGVYQEHRMTFTIDSVLKAWNDPRQAVFYKPTAQSVTEGNPTFKGLQSGLNRETITEREINLNDVSLLGAIFRDVPNGIDGQFMQYAELQFALAEAVTRGYITGNAKGYYEKGIAASFLYFKTTLPADYFSRVNVAFDGSDNLTKILTQKWLSLITNGHEAWFNIRRTGIPKLTPGPDNFNADRYPVRYLYPESEQAVNNSNYQDAAARMGGDNINSKVWWEK